MNALEAEVMEIVCEALEGLASGLEKEASDKSFTGAEVATIVRAYREQLPDAMREALDS